MIIMQTRRLTAKKVSISEICSGKFIKKSGFESSYVLSNVGRMLSRVRVMGLIVDKFIREDSNYASITLDDGKQTIRCKVFVNTKIFLENQMKGSIQKEFLVLLFLIFY